MIESQKQAATETSDAERRVAALEGLALGDPWQTVADAAKEAVQALADACADCLFPVAIRPVGADVIADLGFFAGDVAHHDYGDELVAIAARAADGEHWKLVDLIMTDTVRRRVVQAAERRAMTLNRDQASYGEQQARRFACHLAGVLHARGRRQPWAELLAATVPALQRRLEAAEQRHKEHAANEFARLERERLEAEAVITRARNEYLEELATFFSSRRGQQFVINGTAVTGNIVARYLLDGADPQYIDQAERARAGAQAREEFK